MKYPSKYFPVYKMSMNRPVYEFSVYELSVYEMCQRPYFVPGFQICTIIAQHPVNHTELSGIVEYLFNLKNFEVKHCFILRAYIG